MFYNSIGPVGPYDGLLIIKLLFSSVYLAKTPCLSLDVCRRFSQDEEIILLAIGSIQNLVQDSYVNRCRLADSDGLIILSQVYYNTESDPVKTRCLHAMKNLLGNSM